MCVLICNQKTGSPNKVFICSACKRINLKSRSISYRKELLNELCHFDVYSPFKFKNNLLIKAYGNFMNICHIYQKLTITQINFMTSMTTTSSIKQYIESSYIHFDCILQFICLLEIFWQRNNSICVYQKKNELTIIRKTHVLLIRVTPLLLFVI